MPNGYFLEGFFLVKDAKSNQHLVSLPYVGFRGEYQNLRGIEKPIYEYTGSDKPFYYYKDKTDYPDGKIPDVEERHPDNHFTSLISYVYENGESVAKTLGQDGEKFDGDQLYFSPNNDSSFDSVKVKAVMLRNVENVHLTVYKKEDTERKQPIYEIGNEVHRKTHWSYRSGNRSEEFYEISWEGLDNDGNRLPDGEYQFVISYRPSASGAKKQELNFKVKIDNTSPSIETGSAHYDPKTRVFRPGKIIETGSGVAGTYLSYTKDGETHALTPEEDGSYVIPEGVDLSTIRYSVWDKVYNTAELDLQGNKVETSEDLTAQAASVAEEPTSSPENKETPDKGTLELVFTDSSGEVINYYPSIVRYQVFDDQGRAVTGEFNSSYNGGSFPELPFGTYTVKITLSDYHYDWGTDLVKKVTVSPEDPHPKVTFASRYLSENKLTIGFDKPVPEGTVVKTIDEKGVIRTLAHSIYDLLSFESMLMNGNYRIHVELPAGYRATENDFIYEVTNKINRYVLSYLKEMVIPTPDPDQDSGIIVKPDRKPGAPAPTNPDSRPTFETNKASEKVATAMPLTINYKTASSKQEESGVLPKTGQEDQTSLALSLFGITSLALAGMVIHKKREESE